MWKYAIPILYYPSLGHLAYANLNFEAESFSVSSFQVCCL